METTQKSLKNLMTGTIIASLVLGGVTGGIVGGASFLIMDQFKVSETQTQELTKKDVKEEDKLDSLIQQGDVELGESQIVSIVQQSLPAVVSIIATQELQQLPLRSFNDFFFGFPFDTSPFQGQNEQAPKTEKQQVSSGSGFIARKDGLVITNRHVVLNTEAEYTVITSDGKTYEGEVVDRDSVQDLAVVRIKTEDGEKTEFPHLPLGKSSEVKIGEAVIAIGNTLGEFRNTVTHGIVSGINRTLTAGGVGIVSELIEGAIQTDAAISSGNSGGPLLNLKGEVVGVNTAVSSSGENIGFALPVDQVKLILDSIEKYGKIVRPFLGVRYIMLNEDIAKKNNMKISEGALIIRGETQEDLAVVPGSPADKAGLKENDVILEVNGKAVKEGQSLQTLLSIYKPEDTITLKIYRAQEIMEKKVLLEDRGKF